MHRLIEDINIDLDKIADPAVKAIIIQLLNIIEAQAKEFAYLREENQKLRDENNQLKGGQGDPIYDLKQKDLKIFLRKKRTKTTRTNH